MYDLENRNESDPSPPPVGEPIRNDYYPIRNNEQRLSHRLFLASIEPVVAPPEDYLEIFSDEGFRNNLGMDVSHSVGFVKFATHEEVENFVKHFKDYEFFGEKAEVNDYRDLPRKWKCLMVTNLDPRRITERELYDYFSPYGFVRNIRIYNNEGFIEFDTGDQANYALKRLKDQIYKDKRLYLKALKTTVKPEIEQLEIPLAGILHCDHPFWVRMYQRLYK